MKIRWWQWLLLDWLPVQGLRYIEQIDSADEIPERLPRNAAILVGSISRPKWIAFDCPCQSGHRIMLNLDRTRHPAWSISQTSNRLSISPSVDYYDGNRRCHYFIRGGKVIWSGDSFGEKQR